MTLTWTLVYAISEWLIRVVMLVVVIRRQRPSAAVAWLLVIFFMPEVGAILYLLFGHTELPRRRVERRQGLLAELSAIWNRFESHPNTVHPELDPEQALTVRLAERLGYMPILGGNRVELFQHTQDAIGRLIEDIERAERHVHLMFYIFACDGTGRRVSEALARAAARGVKCRVLTDAVGSRPLLRKWAPRMRKEGIEVFASLPVRLLRFFLQRIDLRNHRKLAIIDGRVAYTGSQNLVDAGYGHKDLVWKDLMVRVEGPILLELQAVFMMDWYFDTNELLDSGDIFPEPEIKGGDAVQVLPSGPMFPTGNYERMVVAAIYGAKERVIITTPYFVPDEGFLQALEVAVLRGVEVVLVLPRRFDQILVGAATRAYYGALLDAGVRVHLYAGGLLHAKTMTIDNAVTYLGTSNFDIRSFRLNLELNLVVYCSAFTQTVQQAQLAYIENATPLTRVLWQRQPTAARLFQDVAKLLSPLL